MKKTDDKTELNIILDDPAFKAILARVDEYIARYQTYETPVSFKFVTTHSYGDKGDPLKDELRKFRDENETMPFNEYLFRLIEEKKLSSSTVYNAAGIDSSTFSRIKNDSYINPKRETVAAIAVAMQLNVAETESLYEAAGYNLTTSATQDMIIRFFLENEIYDFDAINYCLHHRDCPLIGKSSAKSRKDDKED